MCVVHPSCRPVVLSVVRCVQKRPGKEALGGQLHALYSKAHREPVAGLRGLVTP